ncbi:MAG: coproporphyrinogen dehydrogenase HemZ, partial [Candidatus Onthomonas sp.]
MKLSLLGHDYQYAVEQIMLVLFPEERPEPGGEDFAGSQCRSELTFREGRAYVKTWLSREGKSAQAEASVPAPDPGDKLVYDRVLQRAVKQSFYKAALPLLDKKPDWGALTGIRPAKLASKALEEGLTEEETVQRFREEYFVSPQRTRLALEAAKAGLEAKRSLRPEELSLYVGIPFCPTRCAYCSFVSADVQRALKLVEPFLEALDREIDAVAELLPRAGAVIRSVYMGGGTPT